jgi:DnaJ-class molecular chaperone with C-terminal Zn finger domain
MTDGTDYYRVLELDHNATLDEIKKSFRRLVLKYHPDRNTDSNSTQKFIKVVQAYEYLTEENVGKQLDFTDSLIKVGKISLETPDSYSSVKVTQGNAYFYGTLRSSENRQFLVIYRDGFGNLGNWINGKICLIERDYLLWIKEFERPINATISDNGTIALLHTSNKDNSSSSLPREFTDLGGKLTVLDRSGGSLFTYEFGSNIQGCAISLDGNLVSVATLYPDNSVYCFDVEEKRLSWKYRNHTTKVPVLGLEFKENQIVVYTGSNIATMEKTYSLTIDGTLVPEDQKKLDALKKIKRQPAQEKVISLLGMVTSGDQEDVTEGLLQLISFAKTKGAVTHYPKIVKTLQSLLQSNNSQVEPIWKVLRQIIKKEPDSLSPIVGDLISRVKTSHNHNEWVLMVLGELGGAKPSWIKDEKQFIKQKLRSKSWNERRYAAFAIGQIGAEDPSYVRDDIPLLIEYIKEPEKVRDELARAVQKDFNDQVFQSPFLSVKITMSSYTIGTGWPYMIRDACIDAVGMIGKRFPDSVSGVIPVLEKLSLDAPTPYTIKKAVNALHAIKGNPEK